MLDGMVLRSEAGFCQVRSDDGKVTQVNIAKKAKKNGARESTSLVVIGDRVRVRVATGKSSGVIESVLDRRNELSRKAPGRDSLKDVLAANLDVVLLVQSMKQPDINPAQLDRLLAIAEQSEIPPVIILNKSDLAPPEETQRMAGVYRAVGYTVIVSSAKTREGIDLIRQEFRGIAAVIGPSGAGKSSLLNQIRPGLTLRTAEISEATGKGRHTTVAAELLTVGEGAYVADTPGLRSISLDESLPENIGWYYREFRPLLTECRFGNCLHCDEPGCAVRAAVESGDVARSRYASYLHLLEEATEQQRREFASQ
jgi:ribosome biogenesis GTPase